MPIRPSTNEVNAEPVENNTSDRLVEAMMGQAVNRAEVTHRVVSMFQATSCPENILRHIANDTSYMDLNAIANTGSINLKSSMDECHMLGDTCYDGYELHVLVDPVHRIFVNVNTMDELPLTNTTDITEQMARVGWLLQQASFNLETRERILIQVRSNPNILRQISRCRTLRRRRLRLECDQEGDFVTENFGNTMVILVDPANTDYVRIDGLLPGSMIEPPHHTYTNEGLREMFGIPEGESGTQPHDHHDDMADAVAFSIGVSHTLNQTMVSHLRSGGVIHSSPIISDVADDSVLIARASAKTLSEKDEKLIKIANIIKDTMVVELQLDYSESNDTFELYTVEEYYYMGEEKTQKKLILKGHGKDKYDLLKEHFEL